MYFYSLSMLHTLKSKDSSVNEVTLSPAKLHGKLFSTEMWLQWWLRKPLAAHCQKLEGYTERNKTVC